MDNKEECRALFEEKLQLYRDYFSFCNLNPSQTHYFKYKPFKENIDLIDSKISAMQPYNIIITNYKIPNKYIVRFYSNIINRIFETNPKLSEYNIPILIKINSEVNNMRLHVLTHILVNNLTSRS